MQQKSVSGKVISKAITSEDVLGKDVIDSEGGFIGVAEKIFINPETLDLVGISIDKGVMTKAITIGKSYIQKITNHAIFLKIRVVYEIKGMFVFDKHGKKIGKVTSIDLHGSKNKIKRIYVKPNLFQDKISIPINYIKSTEENVLLNVSKSHLYRNKR